MGLRLYSDLVEVMMSYRFSMSTTHEWGHRGDTGMSGIVLFERWMSYRFSMSASAPLLLSDG